MDKGRGNREEGRGAGAGTKQVYLRFIGMREGAAFESAQSGPWDVTVNGDLIVLGKDDHVEHEREREDLEIYSQASGLKTQMAEVVGAGRLGEWREVGVSVWQPVDGVTVLSRAALQAEVNRLHAERDPLVVKARALRMEHGVTSPEFARAWFDVERVTRDLEAAETELERGLEADAEETEPRGGRYAKKRAAWHDNKAGDYPDVDISVVALCTHPDEDGPVVMRMYLSASAGWKNAETDRCTRYTVIGWMTDGEALSLLGKGKAVSHG